MFFGVDDQKNVTGIDQPLDEEERLCSLVADAIAPRLVPTKGAILLFSKEQERHFSDAWVQCGLSSISINKK
ncbi:MAG TPA: hypothetical protein VKN82_00500 [Desulfohalobiaceae bacterium]|nr:hypothetical protein [Desulfohalobiaceae bacterium]